MRFLVDAQLPPALAWMLAKRGHIAEHVTDIGPADLPDRELWQYAIANDAVLITKDEDFAALLLMRGPSPVIVWIRIPNTRRQALLAWFEPLIDNIVELVESGNRLIELR